MRRTFKIMDYDLALDLTVRLGDCLPPNHLALSWWTEWPNLTSRCYMLTTGDAVESLSGPLVTPTAFA